MNRIIPNVFAKDKESFEERFKKLIGISSNMQIVFMDGKFVEAKSIRLEELPYIAHAPVEFEAHLMVENPEEWVSELQDKGFSKIIFHYESLWDEKRILALINDIKNKGMEAWIALNPGTSIAKLHNFLSSIDGVLFMGHQPGIEHIDFADRVYYKIKHLRERNKKLKIQVDGGINLHNLERLNELGVDYFNIGSFIAENENPKAAMNVLEKILAKNKSRIRLF